MTTTVTPLYDLLESLLAHEAKCEARKGCSNPATMVGVVPCGHRSMQCDHCHQQFKEAVATLGDSPALVRCNIDRAAYDLRDIRWVAI